MSDNVYFASKPSKDVAAVLDAKVGEWSNSIESNGFLEKLRMCYQCYHGAYYSDVGSTHQVSFSGEQGELTNFPVNQWQIGRAHV